MDEQTLPAERVYAETCANIRATDDISFKLMGIVPLVSGATLLTFFLQGTVSPDKTPLMAALAVFAALITLGLFRWELRNIQNCSWLRRRSEALEQVVVTTVGIAKQPQPPMRIGKTEAEKFIYSATILAWLVMPPLVSSLVESPRLLQAYVVLAGLIAALTMLSAFSRVPDEGLQRTTNAGR
jgi:hypothetical protein